MKVIFAILFLSISFVNLSQTIFQREKHWLTSPHNFRSSFQNQFDYLDDSVLITKGKGAYAVSPKAFFALEGSQLKYISGIQTVGKIDFNSTLNLSFYNELGLTNTRQKTYQSVLQTKAFLNSSVNTKAAIYDDIRFRLTYKPNEIFTIQGGIDKHFVGEGDRSLLMGNQGNASPFIMMKAQFWKLEYVNLQQIWREGSVGHYLPKGNSSHYLNFNHKNKISFGIFESVTHIIKDTIYNKGFEVEYLNPLILYRPQEYSLGSSDNVILGINGFIAWKKHKLYGQISIDDININELKNRTKWWANKYGIQAGYKAWFHILQTDVFFRSEINLISPYTFASANDNINYSNQGLPIAHPLGANFIEWYNEFAFQYKQWQIHAWAQVYMKGNDPSNSPYSFGGDIYKSYLIRPYGDFGYSIGVGERVYALHLGTQISRTITKKLWTIFLEPRGYIIRQNSEMTIQPFFTVGIHLNLLGDNRNY